MAGVHQEVLILLEHCLLYYKSRVFSLLLLLVVVRIQQSYPTWGYPVNEYVYYVISTGSNIAGFFSTFLIVPYNNDITSDRYYEIYNLCGMINI